jgi:hypothetical protein
VPPLPTLPKRFMSPDATQEKPSGAGAGTGGLPASK